MCIRYILGGAAALAVLVAGNYAFAQGKVKAVYTGGAAGAYHTLFAPPVLDALGKAYFKGYSLTTSAGTLDNINKVSANPQSIGFAQLDVYARQALAEPETFKKLTVIRQLACEGLWMVTKGDLDDFGKVLGMARRAQFVLPPENSGSSATFNYLKQIDPDGLGRARNVRFAQSTTDMLNQVAGSKDDIGLFVQFADPENANIKLINEKGLKVIPVISREIVAAKAGDTPVYQVQSYSLTAGGWVTSGKQVNTSCTPVVIFTGNPDVFTDRNDKDDQIDLVKKIREVPDADMLPKEGRIAALMRNAKALAGPAITDLIAATELARKKVEELTR